MNHKYCIYRTMNTVQQEWTKFFYIGQNQGWPKSKSGESGAKT